MRTKDESGIALVLSLFLMLALSVVGTSMMFLSQTETYSSMNYRLMSQARYGAESGAQKAMNYLMNSYALPPNGGADPLSNYDTTVSPVKYAGKAVVLSSNSAVPSNYPVAAVQTAFNTAAAGSLLSGNATVTFAPYATLISMEQVPASKSMTGNPFTIQTWEVTSDGTIAAGARTAQVQVTSVIETQKISTSSPALGYAAFSTAGTCGALKFTTGSTTDSYDSTQPLSAGKPVTALSGGNVGTNGNLNGSGGATVNGSLATPRVGVGSCSSGNVTAATASGGATVTGGIINLPQAVTMVAPPVANPAPPTTANTLNTSTATCATAAMGTAPACTGSAGVLTLNPAGATMSLGNVSIGNSSALHLTAGTYNFNSLLLSGGSLVLDSGPVIINITGAGVATPIDWQGGDIINPTFNAANLLIQYGGTGSVLLHLGVDSLPGAKNGMMIYAPNAPVTFSQGGDFYGAIVANTFSDMGVGGVKLHYDRNLMNSGLFTAFQASNSMMSSFSWKKY
jgi:hypothetical protein